MATLRQLIHEIHRRSLWQVLGVYLVGAYIAYEIVVNLTEGLGLPAWVPPMALVLFVVGLPIVIATAVVQEGLPARGGTGTEGAVPTPDPRNADPMPSRPSRRRNVLTWPRALTAGVLAFAVLGLATTGFMGMRALGIGPAGTLVAKGVLDDDDALVLADFEAVGGHDNAAAVRAALRTDLETSTAVRLLDEASVQAALRRMEREPGSPLTAAVARELAVREGLKATLEGEVTRLGSGWVVAAGIVAAGTGEPLATFRETADDESDLIAAVDRLSQSIREKVGEKLSLARAGEPLEEVTTSSLEALRLYARATELHDRRADNYGASLLLEQALALDSTFAMAWRKLAVALANAGLQPSRRDAAIERAFRLRHRLTERERLITEGTYFTAEGDLERAIRAYRAVLERHPTDPIATTNLSATLVRAGRYEEALASIRRSYDLGVVDPFLAAYEAWSLWNLGREDEARSAARKGAAELPDDPIARLTEVITATNSGRYDRADSLAAAFEGDLPNEGSGAYWKLVARASIDGIRGRQARVDARVDRFLPVALERLARLHDERGETEQAARYYARFVELWEDVDPQGRARVEAARRRLAALTGEGSGR